MRWYIRIGMPPALRAPKICLHGRAMWSVARRSRRGIAGFLSAQPPSPAPKIRSAFPRQPVAALHSAVETSATKESHWRLVLQSGSLPLGSQDSYRLFADAAESDSELRFRSFPHRKIRAVCRVLEHARHKDDRQPATTPVQMAE